jgi:Na+-transporting methylmalonyl-CoA/oxaloacetate decarboxylase gamma subunit
MGANLNAAIEISLIGMGFVLAALVLLSLVMALLVRLTAEPQAPPEVEPESAPAACDPALKQRAAAAAVAVAVAVAQPVAPTAPAGSRSRPVAQLSPWQAARRAQQLRQRERRR